MRNCWKLLLPLTLLVGCQDEDVPGPSGRQVDLAALSHGMIELGEKLEDPYTVENMREAVARLPPALRTVVMLRYFEDKTLDEMVKIMGVPSGTVKCRLHRARLRLKDVLSELFDKGGKSR